MTLTRVCCKRESRVCPHWATRSELMAFGGVCGPECGSSAERRELFGAHPSHEPGRAAVREGVISMSASLATRRVVATFLAAGALVGAAALPAAADGHRRDHRAPQSSIVIGEVQYTGPGRSDRSARALNGEWVEVKNTGRHSVNIARLHPQRPAGQQLPLHRLPPGRPLQREGPHRPGPRHPVSAGLAAMTSAAGAPGSRRAPEGVRKAAGEGGAAEPGLSADARPLPPEALRYRPGGAARGASATGSGRRPGVGPRRAP